MQEKDGAHILRRKFNIRRTATLLEEGLTVPEIAVKLGTTKSEIRRCVSEINKKRLRVKNETIWKTGR